MIDVVCDLSHNNASVDLAAAQQDGIAAVFHKATQGLAFVDHMYAVRRRQAEQLGLMWGAYHYGTGGDGRVQADHFLETALPNEQTLIVLDLEENTAGESMNLGQAYDFINRVRSQTGRCPGLYAGDYVRELLKGVPDAMFQNCWLWLADYRSEPHIIPAWQRWTFWQWTGTGTVAGVAGNCDRSQFNGTPEELQAFWTGASQ